MLPHLFRPCKFGRRAITSAGWQIFETCPWITQLVLYLTHLHRSIWAGFARDVQIFVRSSLLRAVLMGQQDTICSATPYYIHPRFTVSLRRPPTLPLSANRAPCFSCFVQLICSSVTNSCRRLVETAPRPRSLALKEERRAI